MPAGRPGSVKEANARQGMHMPSQEIWADFVENHILQNAKLLGQNLDTRFVFCFATRYSAGTLCTSYSDLWPSAQKVVIRGTTLGWAEKMGRNQAFSRLCRERNSRDSCCQWQMTRHGR